MRTRLFRVRAFGDPRPIGIPPVFLADVLAGSHSPLQPLSPLSLLLAEYLDATGYVFDWGHIIAVDVAPFTVWRIVPVRLWETLRNERMPDRLRIPDLLPRLAPIARAVVEPHAPRGLVLGGLQREGRGSPHALFALVLIDPAARRRVDRWLECRFVPHVLPALLGRLEPALRELLANRRRPGATIQRVLA
jgi:hypothetical protein